MLCSGALCGGVYRPQAVTRLNDAAMPMSQGPSLQPPTRKVEGSSQWRAGDWDGIGGVLQDCGNPRSRASERERVGLSKTAAAQS